MKLSAKQSWQTLRQAEFRGDLSAAGPLCGGPLWPMCCGVVPPPVVGVVQTNASTDHLSPRPATSGRPSLHTGVLERQRIANNLKSLGTL